MIRIKPTDSVINPTFDGKRIYKQSLVNCALYREWELDKVKRFGSVKAYYESQISGEEYFKNLGWK